MAAKRSAGRRTLGAWLIADVSALGIPAAVARQAAILCVRSVREDLLRAATALDADPALGIAARVLACRLGYALRRLGDPEQIGQGPVDA